MGFISLSVRLLMNLESLNSVETIGSLVRHRTAPIAVPVDEGFVLRFVPVISGESIAHAYQEMLVKEALRLNLPVGVYSRRGEFVKFADDRFMQKEGVKPPQNENDILRAEVDVLLKDIVADIGGFLYAGDYSIKRTSRFQVGYMIPALKEVDVAALEAQFHVRMVPSHAKEKGKKGLAPPQAPFNVEVGSAVYTFTFNLDVDGIAEPSTKFGNVEDEKLEQLRKQKSTRVKVAITSLVELLSSMEFGAKRTRFLPNTELLSAVLAYSENGQFVVSPGNSKDYISLTLKRSNGYLKTLKSLGYDDVKVELIAVDREKATKDVEINTVETIEDLLGWIAGKVLIE